MAYHFRSKQFYAQLIGRWLELIFLLGQYPDRASEFQEEMKAIGDKIEKRTSQKPALKKKIQSALIYLDTLNLKHADAFGRILENRSLRNELAAATANFITDRTANITRINFAAPVVIPVLDQLAEETTTPEYWRDIVKSWNDNDADMKVHSRMKAKIEAWRQNPSAYPAELSSSTPGYERFFENKRDASGATHRVLTAEGSDLAKKQYAAMADAMGILKTAPAAVASTTPVSPTESEKAPASGISMPAPADIVVASPTGRTRNTTISMSPDEIVPSGNFTSLSTEETVIEDMSKVDAAPPTQLAFNSDAGEGITIQLPQDDSLALNPLFTEKPFHTDGLYKRAIAVEAVLPPAAAPLNLAEIMAPRFTPKSNDAADYSATIVREMIAIGRENLDKFDRELQNQARALGQFVKKGSTANAEFQAGVIKDLISTALRTKLLPGKYQQKMRDIVKLDAEAISKLPDKTFEALTPTLVKLIRKAPQPKPLNYP